MCTRCIISVYFWYLTNLSYTSFFSLENFKFYLAMFFNLSQGIQRSTLIATISSAPISIGLILADFRIWDLWSLLRVFINIPVWLMNAASELPEPVSNCFFNILFPRCTVLLPASSLYLMPFGVNVNVNDCQKKE